ncbi:MAG: SAM-dependent methyltransferase, partial [Inhella sp.]
MNPKALIDETARLLGVTLRFEKPADQIVSDYFKAHRELGSRERHALAETTYAVLRRRLLFQNLAQSG